MYANMDGLSIYLLYVLYERRMPPARPPSAAAAVAVRPTLLVS